MIWGVFLKHHCRLCSQLKSYKWLTFFKKHTHSAATECWCFPSALDISLFVSFLLSVFARQTKCQSLYLWWGFFSIFSFLQVSLIPVGRGKLMSESLNHSLKQFVQNIDLWTVLLGNTNPLLLWLPLELSLVEQKYTK